MIDSTLTPSSYTDTYGTYNMTTHNWIPTEDYVLIKTGMSLTEYYSTEEQATVMRNWAAEYGKDYLMSRLTGANKKILEYLTVKDPDIRLAILDFYVEIIKSAMFIGGLQENIAVRNTQGLEKISPAAYQLASARDLLYRYYTIYLSPEDYRKDY